MIQPFAGRGGWSSETTTTPSSPLPRTNYWESSTAEDGNRRGRGTTANRRGAIAFLRLFTVFGRPAGSYRHRGRSAGVPPPRSPTGLSKSTCAAFESAISPLGSRPSDVTVTSGEYSVNPEPSFLDCESCGYVGLWAVWVVWVRCTHPGRILLARRASRRRGNTLVCTS